ncbi:MAG TPA: hypothetical protein PKG96_09825 [Bacilli bacterium]|nr:hypothetical protein [Bacilli bacterium]
MTDRETANHIRNYVKKNHGVFSWPTDACGYEQHIKFADYRNKNWTVEKSKLMTFEEFCLEYADKLLELDREAQDDRT